jgi:hypothetical protein
MMQDLLVSLFGLPCPGILGSRDLYGVQEGIIQLPMQLTCSTILHPEALLKLCVSNKRGDIEPANISFSDIQAGFFNKKSGPTNWPADL